MSPEDDAEALHKAMKGLGADDKVMIDIICNRSNEHLQHVREAYEHKFNRSLTRDVDSETSGPYQEALLGLLMTPAEYDVRCIHTAMKGTGCDKEVIFEHLSHRTAAEMAAIEAAYLRIIGRTLEYDLKSELGGENEKLFIALVQGTKNGGANSWTPEEVARDAEVLYKAGAGRIGCDEYTFIHILTSKGQAFIHELDDVYAKHAGDTLAGVIKKEFGGFMEQCLLALMTPHDEYYAQRINAALAGVGSDDQRLVRIVVSRRPHLAGINHVHQELYHSTLRHRIETEVGGDLKKVMVSLTTGI